MKLSRDISDSAHLKLTLDIKRSLTVANKLLCKVN